MGHISLYGNFYTPLKMRVEENLNSVKIFSYVALRH
jgi:hypothetical protein